MDSVLLFEDFSDFMPDVLHYCEKHASSHMTGTLDYLQYIKILEFLYEELDRLTEEHCSNLYGDDHIISIYPSYTASINHIMLRTMNNPYLQRLETPIGRYVFSWVYAHSYIHFSCKADYEGENADQVMTFLDSIDYEWRYESRSLYQNIEQMSRIIGTAVMLAGFDDYLPYTFHIDELANRLFSSPSYGLPRTPDDLYRALLIGNKRGYETSTSPPVFLPPFLSLVSEITFILQSSRR